MTETLGIIGDIHGSIRQVIEIVELALKRADRLVFVGDYVDGGPESAEVLEYLCEMHGSQRDVVFLAGHHDVAFRLCLDDGVVAPFLQMGGAATIRSYLPEAGVDVLGMLLDAVPSRHRRFLDDLRSEHREEGLRVTHERSHSGVATLANASYEVAGHSPRKTLTPDVRANYALIDTGCGTWPDGPLTCLFWPSRQWIQSFPKN